MQTMTLLRIRSARGPRIRIVLLALLLAACFGRREERWAPVPAGAGPLACSSARLQARGYAVDTAQASVLRATTGGPEWEAVVTAQIQPDSAVRITSDLFSLENGERRRFGVHISKQVEVGNAMESCGFDR
jgi:hypothetical protein